MFRFATVAAVLALMAAPLVAQESTDELKKELDALRKEVDGLKAQQAQYQSKEVQGNGQVAPGSMAPDGDSPLMTAFKSTKLSGFVDVGYEFSFNQLNTNIGTRGAVGNNPVRIFDNADNSFYLHEVHLQLERLASKDLIVGYHFELVAGHDPALYDQGVLAGSGLSSGVSLQEGWLQVLIPMGNGIDLRAGRMATLVGYEVLENMNNMNYSRGMLFGLIQPFTHTGIRAAYGMGGKDNDQLTFTVGLNNGFNAPPAGADINFVDQDHGKCLEFQIAAKPVKDLTASLTLLVDNDVINYSGSTGDGHWLADLVLAYTMDKLTLALNYDYTAWQNAGGAAGPINAPRAQQSGIAFYAKYALNDWFNQNFRFEYFSDTDGVLLGGVGPGFHGTGSRVIEFTITEEFKVAQQMIVRVEFRHDDSNNHDFVRDAKTARGDNTLGFEAILPF